MLSGREAKPKALKVFLHCACIVWSGYKCSQFHIIYEKVLLFKGNEISGMVKRGQTILPFRLDLTNNCCDVGYLMVRKYINGYTLQCLGAFLT